eukprot:scaffold90783_cov15-Tisochrysis_lutea.AAC.1
MRAVLAWRSASVSHTHKDAYGNKNLPEVQATVLAKDEVNETCSMWRFVIHGKDCAWADVVNIPEHPALGWNAC